MQIKTVHDFRRAIRQGPYAWPGGYPVYFITSDGGAMSFATAKKERRAILHAIAYDDRTGWKVEAVEINYEDKELVDDHTGEKIECAYCGDIGDEGPNLEDAELFADSNRGVYIPQHFAEAVKREMVTGVTEEDYATLAEGPDAEWYWDTWDRVLSNAVVNHPTLGECYLHQDGDLWIVPKGK